MLGFLDLPCELRTQIYRQLFHSANCKTPLYLGSKQNAMNLNRSYNTAIFRLNKFVYREAMEEIYGKNCFLMRPFTKENCLPSLSPMACHHIRRLRIDLDGSPEENDTFQAIWKCALQRLNRLEEICLLLPHTPSYVLETIVAVSEFIVNPAANSGHFFPHFNLDLSIITARVNILPFHSSSHNVVRDLPSCAQSLGLWTNVSFYDGNYNRSRAFNMDVPKRKTKPNVLIKASTSQYELQAIQGYRNKGWSFRFNHPISSEGRHKGRRYLATFQKPEIDANFSSPSSPRIGGRRANVVADSDAVTDADQNLILPIRAAIEGQ
ncbi:MAG: hypothetical protein Q9160_007095 [Pyrenula sp. 1 TL-2023]